MNQRIEVKTQAEFDAAIRVGKIAVCFSGFFVARGNSSVVARGKFLSCGLGKFLSCGFL